MAQQKYQTEGGVLYLVSTPIGNLRDISLRALDVLSQVDLIAAEDTRRTRILLQHYSIATPCVSYYDYNKESRTPQLLEKLERNDTIAMVSDAGTPGISDPAFYLVNAALKAGISVRPVPGATALIAALVSSGLATDRFVFEGFLPVRKGRNSRLRALSAEPRTIVLYESARRVSRTLGDLLKHLGPREVAVMREMTKKYEEYLRGDLESVLSTLETKPLKGEIVIVVEGLTRKRRKSGECAPRPHSKNAV